MGSSDHVLAGLVDLDRVQRLFDSLSAAFDIGLAVLDPDGTVLIASGWQEICTRFHRAHEETLRGCLQSDLRINERLREGLGPSEHYAYKCANGLWDVAFPLVIAGDHVANIFTGQFFFDDDDVDAGSFAEQARRLGFDEQAYLEALARVPVISHERLQTRIDFLIDFVGMLGEMGMSALLREREQERLKESERRYRHLFDNATDGLTVFGLERDADGGVQDLVVVDLNPTQAARTHAPRDQVIGRRMSECDDVDERLHTYCEFVTEAVRSGRPARREVRLELVGAYELLSAYPAGRDLWALSATDVTELREAERALHRQEEGIREAYVDVLDAVTGGKLILLTEEALQDELGAPLNDAVAISSARQLAEARREIVAVAERGYPGRIPRTPLLNAVCEALENALKHAHGGTYQVFARDGCVQVAITDRGPGIDFRTLPKATLTPGFSTAASLGMGFTIMLHLCERVLLSTQPGHTAVVLEMAAEGDSGSGAGAP